MLPVSQPRSTGNGNGHAEEGGCGSGCGTGNSSCGAGLEKVYPTTAVRYGAMNWIGEFSYRPGTVFKCGAKVVIETERGTELGQQVSLSCQGCTHQVSREQIQNYIRTSGPEFFRINSGRILREATPQDIDEHAHLNSHLCDDIDECALVAAQLNLDMKIVTVEHLLGGERIVYYFRSETRVDFRTLVRELSRSHHTRIEMRQVGARDEARLVADFEICGRECCCKNFLKKMRPVNMRMAKVQKSTLDPSKVSGRCGRLRCCLRYEHEGYEALDAKLTRIGERVGTEFGDAMVINRQILTQLLLVRTDDDREFTIPLEEIRAATSAAPAPRAAETAERDEGRSQRRRPERRQRDERPAPRREPEPPAPEDISPESHD